MPSSDHGPKDGAEDDHGILDFVADLTEGRYSRVEEDLGDGFVRLESKEAERRQARHDIRQIEIAVIEMLRNSRDAGATTIMVATSKDSAGLRVVTILDDGKGVPANLSKLIFNPRVTSKLDSMVMDEYGVHGRGMALYSIAQATVSAEVVWSQMAVGTVLKVISDSYQLSERKDQSSPPELVRRSGEWQVLRGPKNIIRTVVEFALRHKELKIYLGSPVEIAATCIQLASADGQAESPWSALRHDSDVATIGARLNETLGLEVSIRSIHRIISGEASSVTPMPEHLNVEQPPVKSEKYAVPSTYSQPISVNLSKQDVEEISSGVGAVVGPVADRYFANVGKNIKVRFNKESGKLLIEVQLDQVEQ